jgi:hypothetical protein
MLDLMISNEEKIEAKANQVARKVRQYLLDINAAGDLGEDATKHGWKMSWSFKTDEGYYRDLEITVQVNEKPHKLMGGTKFGTKNGKSEGDDGQLNFLGEGDK